MQNFKTLALIETEYSVTKKILEKKRQIKGMICKRMLNLFYMIQPLMSDVCTKFQNPRCSSFLENFAKTFIRVKEKWINTGTISIRMLILSYTIQVVVPDLCTKFQNLYAFYWNETWKKEGKKKAKYFSIVVFLYTI